LMRSKSENPSSYEHLELKGKVMSGNLCFLYDYAH
jgi:hypothetical protein